MATFAAAKVAVPSFCGLRQEMPAAAQRRVAAGSVAVHRASPIVSASAESLAAKAGKAMLGFAAGAALLAASGSAHAAVVKMGADGGDLKFVPDSLSVAAGETITFKNNAGFPHNVVFDEDAVPSGVNADSISHPDYLNAPGEEFSVTLDKPGTYEFYCEPHQGGGMKGVVTVS